MPLLQDQIDAVRSASDPGFVGRAMMDSNYNTGNMKNRYMAALMGGPMPGDATTAAYQKQLQSFDPNAAMQRYAQGAYGSIFDAVGGVRDQLKDLEGQAVGAGRLNTGFYDQDKGEVVGRGVQSLNNAIAGQAMNATNLQLRATEDQGQLGQDQSNRYLDLLSGGLDRTTAEDNARAQRSADFWGGLISTGGKIASAAIMA